MKEYRLIINPFAEQDITDARNWYNLQKENLGNEFVKHLEKAILRIKNNPYQFPLIFKKIRKAVLNKFPCSLFFYINKNVINIFAVFHFYRNPSIWKERLNT